MERIEHRAEAGASADGSTPAPSEASGRGARSAVSDAQRWMRFSFALAAQLEQRARALRVLEDQRSWVAEREPTTSAGPSMAQIAARLDEMPEDLRFPPALLDALLTEAVGGAFVDLSDDGGCSVPGGVDGATERSESKVEATSEPGEESSTAVYRSIWEDEGTPEPEEQEVEASDGETTAPERATSEAEAALGPVPDEWLIAAKSWHKAKKYFGRGGKRVRERTGFRCPCEDCQRSDGRFRGQDFRAFTWHFGKYPFKFGFSCPVEGCASVRSNRNGLRDHLRTCHGPQSSDDYEDWMEGPMGRFQSTARGPTRLDPFFRPNPTVLIDEPLPPKEWRAYLAALRRPSASDGGEGGSEAEGSGSDEPEAADGGDGRSAAEVEGQPRASSAGRAEPDGESTEAEGTAEDGGPAAAVAGAAVLVAATGAGGSDERRSKKKKAAKRDREATNGGDGATASKKRKPGGGDSDFNPDSDEEQ
ncbi:hypothetical protein AAVH_37875 [Aphelenchoides avenae]|nr:hypothetical protein AAVH_37875 [Aphelenchus avenae]